MKIINCIRQAVKIGLLKEPFNAYQVHQAITQLPNCNYPLETIQNFLPKHRKNNPTNQTELFERINKSPVQYKLI
jgi:hypothetical protein